MDSRDFALMVSEDIKNKADQKTKDYLRLKENWNQWRDCIITIVETVTDKIETLNSEARQLRETYSDFINDPAASISAQIEKSERFRFHAEKRLAEVDRLIMLDGDHDPNVSLATFLRDAIMTHQQLKKNIDMYDTFDIMLWDAVDGKWSF